jgi:hypothetical protein
MIQTRCGLHGRLCELQKGCTPVTTVSDKAYQLLAHGRWFSPGTPVSSTNIDEILLKVPLNTNNQINQVRLYVCYIVWVRSGQEEYTEPIHLSEFKIVTVWFEGQHNDELYAYFLDLWKLMLSFNQCMIHFILVL